MLGCDFVAQAVSVDIIPGCRSRHFWKRFAPWLDQTWTFLLKCEKMVPPEKKKDVVGYSYNPTYVSNGNMAGLYNYLHVNKKFKKRISPLLTYVW